MKMKMNKKKTKNSLARRFGDPYRLRCACGPGGPQAHAPKWGQLFGNHGKDPPSAGNVGLKTTLPRPPAPFRERPSRAAPGTERILVFFIFCFWEKFIKK